MVRSLSLFNKALLCKWCWHFASEGDSLWKKIIKCKFGEKEGGGGQEWRVKFWKDWWCGEEPLCEIFPSLFALSDFKEAWVADLWEHREEGHSMKREQEDTVVWKGGNKGVFSVRVLYSMLLYNPVPFKNSVDPWIPSKVKVKNWVDGKEHESLVGLTARFGASLPTESHDHLRLPAVFSNPMNCCSDSSSELSGSIALSTRGDCSFMAKAKVAQSGDAAALLVINDKEDIYKMVCSENDTIVNITIPVVMIPKSGGDTLSKSIADGKKEQDCPPCLLPFCSVQISAPAS
ncbi:Signal peptide peptidase-like 2 [Vitis vinifera]|uniref:Signal peptide peptidase-like 2 n=1 Tax=Vitis vinifera TaxID=29760 RepID=A0A438BTA0_VITVI|nr:Signal peptide peptidase-like 2 [Vitis vinifera]